MSNIFDFTSYKSYLTELCHQERGLLTRLAEAAPCQKSYLSSCLNGKNNLTLDHALGISEHLQLTDNEQSYFFLLLEKEKAGTAKLRRHLDDKLKALSREAYRLKNLQKDTQIISDSVAMSGLAFYYANWMATAIHTLTSINTYQTPDQIAQRLQIHPQIAKAVLGELEKQSLVNQQRGRYRWNSGNLHLSDNSQWISTYHTNWRLRAIDNAHRKDPDSSHYTAIQSLSLEDFETLKKKIAGFIKEFNKISDPSDPEEAFCLNIDFFKI